MPPEIRRDDKEGAMEIKTLALAIVAALEFGRATASCGWNLNSNECICMNSANGRVMSDETSLCCQEMGLSAASNVGLLSSDAG